jgi:PEGA domain
MPGMSSSPSSPSEARYVAPSHPQNRDQNAQGSRRSGGEARGGGESRGSGGNGGGEHRAVPRGSNGSNGSSNGGGNSGGRTTASSSTATAAARSEDSSAPQRRAVPAYSRPRDGRVVTGQAVERTAGRPIYVPGNSYYYYPYYPYYWGSGLGFGLGYLYYDPFFNGGFGYGGYGGYGYDPYGYSYGGYQPYGTGGGYSPQDPVDGGSLRLKLKPREAQVFIDGYYVGIVDSYDGAFQKLSVEKGGHKVELKAEGYEPLSFDVLITPGETVTYKGEMKRIQ